MELEKISGSQVQGLRQLYESSVAKILVDGTYKSPEKQEETLKDLSKTIVGLAEDPNSRQQLINFL